MSIIRKDIPVAMCSDHAGYELKNIIMGYLESQGVMVKDFGTYSTDSCDYPDYAHPAAEAVGRGECYPCIAICGTGNGIAMTLNKHRHIRAAICWDEPLAELARQHNDANTLVLPGRFIEHTKALAVVDKFMETEFEGGRHARRISKIPVPDSGC